MNILALGCSFTKGAELVQPTTTAWPARLAELTGWNIDNHAEHGGSNDMMFRKAMEMSDNYDTVIIAWTEVHRLEVWLNDPVVLNGITRQPGPLSVNSNCSEQVFPWAQDYFATHYNVQYNLRRWLAQVVALQAYFESIDKKYIFLSAWGNVEELRKFKFSLTDKINVKNWVDYPKTIRQWTHKLPQGNYMHPLEQGHQLVAEKIYEHIRNRGWLS